MKFGDNMEDQRKKELKERYKNRHPDMGIVCWKCKDHRWISISRDVNADFNSTSFQLKLGSWPNIELQTEYSKNPDGFEWSVEKQLEYKELTDDLNDDLELMLLEYLEEFPDAKPMKRGQKFKK